MDEMHNAEEDFHRRYAPQAGEPNIEGMRESLRLGARRVAELENALEKMTDLLEGTTAEERDYRFYSWQRIYQDIERLKSAPNEQERALRELVAKWRDRANEEEYKLHREWAIDQCADELEAALATPERGGGK